MQESISVGLSDDSLKFLLYGGIASGRDAVHAAVVKWPGWRRLPTLAETVGRKVSVYTCPVSPVSALSLSQTAMKVHWREGAQEVVEGHLRRLQHCRTYLSQDMQHVTGPTFRKPMPHQTQAAQAIQMLEGRVLLADDMGLGKTSTSLWAAWVDNSHRILVICPASVKFNWRREVKATLGWPTYVIDGTPKKRADIIAEATAFSLQEEPMAIVINYDLLRHLNEFHTNWLSTWIEGGTLICDESHYLKSRGAARTKFVMEHLAPFKGGAKNRILLSGTPVRNLVDDLWSQIQIIRPYIWTSYWDFAKRHLVMRSIDFGGGRKPVEKPVGTKDVAGLNAVINTLQIRRNKEDVLDLPPKIHTYPELELVGDHKKVYKAMKDLAVLELSEIENSESIWAPQARNAVTAAMRCEQIAQGFCGGVPEPLVEQLSRVLAKYAKSIPGRPREIIFPDAPKLVWLMEQIDGLLLNGKRPVIFSRFNAPMFWLWNHYLKKVNAGILHGGVGSVVKDQLITDFQDGKMSMMFIQVKMAEGFNLHNSQDCIFLGRDWSPAINAQAEDRLHRIGQKGTVNVQIPIVRGTIEMMINRKLASKDSDAKQALKTVTIKELMEAL